MIEARNQPAEASGFDAYLRNRGISGGVTRWETLSGGRSATSVRVGFVEDGNETNAVLHLATDPGPLTGLIDISRRYDLLEALAAMNYPAPRPLGLLPTEWLGREGYLSEFVQGHAPDPWRASGRAFIDKRGETIETELITRLAEIHALPIEQLPLSIRANAGTEAFGQRERRRWSEVVGRSEIFSGDPLIAYADAWLEANCPGHSGETLIHGDYRIGNLVFDDEGRIVSVLDWELAEIGDPIYDVATLCSPALEIAGKAAGLGDAARLIDRYEACTGRSLSPETLAFFRVLATCLWVNASLASEKANKNLAALRAHFSVHETRPLLASALGLRRLTMPRRDEVLKRVTRALRKAERDIADSDVRDVVRTCTAILAAHAGSSPVVALDAEAIDRRAREIGDPVAIALCGSGNPLACLAAIVRTAMLDRAIACDLDKPIHRRLRGLIADTLYAGSGLAEYADHTNTPEGARLP